MPSFMRGKSSERTKAATSHSCDRLLADLHTSASLRVGLVFRPCLFERGKLATRGVDGDDPGKTVERHLKTPRVINLRHQTDIGERDLVAKRKGSLADHCLDGGKTFDNPVVIPRIDL